MLSHGASIFDVTTAWLSMMLAYPCIPCRGCLVLFWGGDVMKLVEIETNNMKLAQKFLFFFLALLHAHSKVEHMG